MSLTTYEAAPSWRVEEGVTHISRKNYVPSDSKSNPGENGL